MDGDSSLEIRAEDSSTDAAIVVSEREDERDCVLMCSFSRAGV